MLVFEILQNGGLLCASSLSSSSLAFFLSFSMLYTSTLYVHTLFCVCSHAHKAHLHPLSLMCQRLLIMRFLQDGKLQGDWVTAHFKHCSLPLLLFPPRDTEDERKMGRRVKTYSITYGHILSLWKHKKSKKKYVGPCGFPRKKHLRG